ncbi:acyl carrier protein [Streptomyces sp. NPDC048376]|jgi:act minimal PKS acyl carrier protein|uniref:acyl carrier protein n=1 Tax=unclassified Streptomyces TaxID=2593676 RepID=UPI000978D757|nr:MULTISPECIES: acyl carrier protein [unclassified Streptomyces]MBQ0888938.1 acyl carrier protein [Streptomyces sp. RM72]OMI87523.1 actinorhodin polyketide synthase [Streptomyces sp. M1013]
MGHLTLDQLLDILRDCAGEDESVDLTGDVLHTSFLDLGYDSLAMLQATGRIERDLGVALPDDVVAEAETPYQLLAVVNATRPAQAAA